jgi:hypothetical protein
MRLGGLRFTGLRVVVFALTLATVAALLVLFRVV